MSATTPFLKTAALMAFLAAIAPILALLRQLGIVRARESGALAGRATAHPFLVSPSRGAAAHMAGLCSTHPPTEARIARLGAMPA